MVALAGLQPNTGKSNEWYTPRYVIEAARDVMGKIHLDPASCEFANRTVKAERYYTQQVNGLVQPWHGKVWLNPPYGKVNNQSQMGRFIQKLVDEYRIGNVTEAILLTTAKCDVFWFEPLWSYTICFASHYVRFDLPDHLKEPKYPTATHSHGSVFVYFGENERRFTEIFSEFGPVIPASVAIRKQKETAPIHLWEVQP